VEGCCCRSDLKKVVGVSFAIIGIQQQTFFAANAGNPALADGARACSTNHRGIRLRLNSICADQNVSI